MERFTPPNVWSGIWENPLRAAIGGIDGMNVVPFIPNVAGSDASAAAGGRDLSGKVWSSIVRARRKGRNREEEGTPEGLDATEVQGMR